MENEHCNAVGYKPVGYVYTEDLAKNIVKNGKVFDKNDGWMFSMFKYNEFRYKEIEEYI